MYNDFSIKSVYTIFSNSSIVIETNFTINQDSVNQINIRLIKESDQSVEVYKLNTDENKIVVTMGRTPEKDEKFILIVSNIEDMLGRKLSSILDTRIEFKPAYKKLMKITNPINNETISSKDVDINIEAVSETDENTNYKIEVSNDIAFFDKEKSVLIKDKSVKISVEKDGQYYVRVRAESEDGKSFGLWSEPITFYVYTQDRDNDHINDDYLEELMFTNELFVDETIPLEVTFKTSNLTLESSYTIEMNKNVEFKEEETSIKKPLMSYEITDGKKASVSCYIEVSKDFPNKLNIIKETDGFLSDKEYEFIIPDLKLTDGTSLNLGTVKYITTQSDCFISIKDIKDSLHAIDAEDECIIGHIKNSSGIALFWANRANENSVGEKIELKAENIKYNNYPFYMYIKYQTLYEVLLEKYIEIATNPMQTKDMLSDIMREEKYDLKYLKDLLDDFQRKADDWLEMIVTITADPLRAVRGKSAYAIDIKHTKPMHKFTYGLDRGGYDRTGRGFR